MKPILLLSDFHGHLPWYDWLIQQSQSGRWGAIIFAGDLLEMSTPPEKLSGQISLVTMSLALTPDEIPLLICSGNHDLVTDGNSWLRNFAAKCPNTYCDGQVVNLQGKSFEIVGWNESPRTAADFYVMHNPPESAKTAISDGIDWGDFLLREHLRAEGGIALCGHVHTPLSWYDRRPGKISFNPAVGDFSKKSEAPPFISIDLVRRRAIRASEVVLF